MTINDMVKITHIPNNSRIRCVLGAFDKSLHGGSIWVGHGDALSFILQKSIFICFVNHGTSFY